MAHGDARDGKWMGNWRMEWVASTLHTTSEHCVSSITKADAHTSAVSSRLNWRPRRFKWTRPFRRKTKSGFCACHHISNGGHSPMAKTRQWLHTYLVLAIRMEVHLYTFTTPNQQNAQTCSLDIPIIISHITFPRISVHKGASSRESKKVIQHKSTADTFVYSWHGVRESGC